MNNQYEDIKQELKQEAPILASIPKSEEMGVPEGYFDELEDHLISVAKLNLITSNESKAELGGYFETLEDTIISRLHESELQEVEAESKQHKVWFLNTHVWRYAAAFIAGAVLFGIGMNLRPTTEKPLIVADQNTEYLDYVLENIDDFDLNSMIEQGMITEGDLGLNNEKQSNTEQELEAYDLFESEINF